MSKTSLLVEEAAKDWLKTPEIAAEFAALVDEFALAKALIMARGNARLTQAQVAEKMGTTQAVVARLESGRIMPSTRTLLRFAEATGTQLRISFEKVKQKGLERP